MLNETSDIHRRNIPKILAQWEEQARKSILSSRGLTSLVLKDSIGTFLKQITDALSTTIERTDVRAAQDDADVLNFAKIHGVERANDALHYTLAEVILEFQILQRVILNVLEEDAPISASNRDIILNKVGQALSGVATQFADVHHHIQEQFALTLVHDLRSPINFVKMGAQLIKQDLTASKQTLQIAKKIDQNMDRLESMLKELLDVSRIQAGIGLAFRIEEFGLDVLAKEVVQEMTAIYGEKFGLDADDPTNGTWNRAGLRRVFENLMVNALKYGSANTIVIVTVSQSASHAILTVHNEGNPIPVKDRPTLFDKFQRTSTATSQTGWGLGLALVKAMVTAHHGNVRIESSQESGTDFIVEIPKIP